MSKYSLYIIVLEGCPYGDLTRKLLNKYKFNNMKIDTIFRENKEKYKTDKINTYPQIYLKRQDSKGLLLLGGYSDLEYTFNKFYNNYSEENINEFLKKNNDWSRKGTLRLIELVNSK